MEPSNILPGSNALIFQILNLNRENVLLRQSSRKSFNKLLPTSPHGYSFTVLANEKKGGVGEVPVS